MPLEMDPSLVLLLEVFVEGLILRSTGGCSMLLLLLLLVLLLERGVTVTELVNDPSIALVSAT